MKLVCLSDLSAAGKSLVAAIVSIASLLQIDAVKNVVMPVVAHHPHISFLIGGLITLGTLLTNPAVQKAIHYHPMAIPPESGNGAPL